MTELRGGELARRWRLILGRYADSALPVAAADRRLESALGYLYDREYRQRGHRHESSGRGAGLGAAELSALEWLGRARALFPASVIERMERDAIARYGLDELLTDPAAVAAVQASPELATALLRIRGRLSPETAAGVRAIIQTAVREIVERIRPTFVTALTGSRARHQRTHSATLRNLDWRGTIGSNLSRVDPTTGKMLIEEIRFLSRRRRRNLDWQVIILVDQSGSMAGSVLHSAICAAILGGLPGITVRLVLFNTSVVDLSHLAADPVDVLMTAQLGGGTNIARAMEFARGLVAQPTRTVLALISDFEEGGSVSTLMATTRALAESGVTLLGLGSLEDGGEHWYNHQIAAGLAAQGMAIASMTPDRFADWLAEVTQ